MKRPLPCRIFFTTLGCRVNQYETQAIREQFLSVGVQETGSVDHADFVVVTTCTVTAESDKESRYRIRRFNRLNPSAKIIVTGCCADRNGREFETMPGVVLVAGNSQKPDLAKLFFQEASVSGCGAGQADFPALSISRYEGRTRANIKIQDGCNHACSFCKVVLVRGRSRSRAIPEIIEEAKRLAEQGTLEIVLTGIQLGAFGYDLKKRKMLTDVLEKLSRLSGLKRIRLSSIEPMDVTGELIDAMSSIEKVCPHLHLPLQSGDDGILKRMNRRYSSSRYHELAGKLRAKLDDFILTTDVIAGFPGEDEPAFSRTLELLKAVLPYKIHIFPYSRREGTKAASYHDQVSPQTVKRRKQILLDLEKELKKTVAGQYVGRSVEVLVERKSSRGKWAEGRMANYLPVKFRPVAGENRPLTRVRIREFEQAGLVGAVAL